MRFCLLAFLGFFTVTSGTAQVGNEWISFNQQYFKIPVAKDGFYKLSQANLVAAGFPSSADPRTFKLYHRGLEQAIIVSGETDGQFNSADYIEFYGQRNDGTMDTELYKNATSQPHKLYNLYSDTTSYFLTFGSVAGKRITTSAPADPGLLPEDYHRDEKLLIIKDQYSGGVDYGDIQSTIFDEGEGWTGNQIVQGQTGTYLLNDITNTVTSASPPDLEVLITGRGPMNHNIELYAGARLLTALNFSGFQSIKHTQAIQWSDIAVDGKLSIAVKVLGSPDRVSVGYIVLRYPQQLNMNGATEKSFILNENLGGTSSIEIQNPVAGTRLFDITDPANIKNIATSETTTLNAFVANTVSSRKLWATNTSLTPSVKRVSFRSINPAAHDFIIISHPLLRKAASGYTDPVKAYAEYRTLPQGGSFDTLVVNIGQLYDQFNYGEQSPLGIFHFMKYMTSVKLPEYLFLVGKGLDVYNNYYRNPTAFTTFKDLIPTAGFPGSDMAYTAALSADHYSPAVATGRLTATGPLDVAAYLNKVKETEARPFDDLRRKNILHLSGGLNPGEPQTFRSYLEQFASVAKTFYLGGEVKAIAKQSTDIELINVADEVNKGLSLITFFGHSSTSATDFDIGLVTDPVMGYNNKGKYPALLMNGCNAGSFFLNASIFGENWVNSPNKGAIGVVAHTAFGFPGLLRDYSTLFYQVAYGDSVFINKGLGDVQKETAKRFIGIRGTGAASVTQMQQMVLLGDPSVRLFGAGKPDYEIKKENVFIDAFNNEPITALTDSFRLNFVVRNFGNAKNKSFRITVTRTPEDGPSTVYDSVFNTVLYSDTVHFTIPGNIENGYGVNTFSIKIDADNKVDELNEDNNSVAIEYFVPLNRTKNLFPQNFAIVSSRELDLSLQHTDLLSKEREFVLEIDTTDTFSSAFKKQFVVKGEVLAMHKISLLDQDTLAYYWRTKLVDPLPNESTSWDVSTFTYISNGPSGWAQVHFPQYADNPTAGLVTDPLLRRIKFEETITDLSIKTFSAASGKPTDSVSVKINQAEYNLHIENNNNVCANNTINLIAFDKKTTQPYPGIFIPWYELNGNFGGRRLLCGREPFVINSFKPTELTQGQNADIIKYVDNIAVGDSVILFNIGDAGYASWPLAAKQKLGELGISVLQIDALQSGEPVVILARKGSAPGSARIYRDQASPVAQQKVQWKGTTTGRVTAGTMNSVIIGPAQSWQRFYVNTREVEISDKVSFDIFGIRANGDQDLLKTNLTDDDDLSGIDATVYPQLKLSLKSEDDVNLTTPQLDYWIVSYVPVPEGLLLYKGTSEAQTIFEGQTWNGDYRFVNISNKNFQDSLLVEFEIVNPETFVTTKKGLKIQAPMPGDTTSFVVPFNTVGHEGMNNVEVFVNPRLVPEQRYDNNFIKLTQYLEVVADKNAPVLDVTFDGRHILNEDFVSPAPHIEITVWDNNEYLLTKDTTNASIFIAYPCADETCPLKAVYFSQPEIEWHPETDTSEFKVHFKPAGLPEGTYTLRVNASDAHGNPSGAEAYVISFQVKNETTVSVSSPFPNPFGHKTNFEIVVSGDEVPSSFDLQIININGKIVHDFTERDVSNFHVGTNTISWSGIDLQGNHLPNGIYFFRLSVRVKDKVLDKKGKIVLVR